MHNAIRSLLASRGWQLNDNAYSIISACDDWYRAQPTDAHRRVTLGGERYELERMGFGRRAAADDANLCEVVSVDAGGGDEDQREFVRSVLAASRFDVEFRRQLELVSAEGTAACYVRLDQADLYSDGRLRGGRIALNYVDALGFIPLTVENGDVIEAGFAGEALEGTRRVTTLVLATIDPETSLYRYETFAFDEAGREIPERRASILLGRTRPFAVMRTAQVNPLPGMQGFGYPKLHGAIPILKGLDAAFTALLGDLDGAEKITLVNEALCSFDQDGMPLPPSAQLKRRFVLLGERLPQEQSLVHEITPAIRVGPFREAIDLLLSLLGQQFGYGSRRYSLDEGGRVVTATEYVGERQDMLQELNRQRYEARAYISGIVRAVLSFANLFQGGAFREDAPVCVEFDDSFITSRQVRLDSMRQDVLSGIGGERVKEIYLREKYGLAPEEV